MRLIDCEALEKAIYKWMPKDQETWMDSDLPPIENLVVSIMMTIQEQPTVEVPQWIPVSERLPDFGVDVLVCNDEGVQVTAKRTGWSIDPNCWAINYCGYDYDSWDFMTNGDIVAWMELPKPYEVSE